MKFLHYFSRCGLLIVLFALCSGAALAQRTVRGKVTDSESGEALIGASVSVVGTTRGASTDVDGNYSVEVPEGSTQIRISYTGYAEQTVDLGASSTLDVSLKPGTVLDEVVVIGYGSVKKSDATGAVTSVTAENFNRGVITAPEQLLQGRAAGVQVTNTNGEPGGAINIRIRGTTSVRANNNPLFVVDGVPLSGGDTQTGGQDFGFGTSQARNPLNFINPSDIASMDVLKDASATAIYGSRGANGVVIITTKKGAQGKGMLTYDYSHSFSTISKRYDLLDGPAFLEASKRFKDEAAIAEINFGANTDWQDEIFRTGHTNTHNLSFGGGDRTGDYRFSIGYQNQNGIVKKSGQQKYTAGFNGSRKFIDDRLTLATQLSVSNIHDDNALITNTAGYEGDLLGAALKANPTRPVFDTSDISGYHQPDDLKTEPNPAALLEFSKDYTNTLRTLGNISAEIRLFRGLSFKTVLGIDRSLGARKTAISSNYNFVNNRSLGGHLFTGDVETENRLWENYFTYDRDMGNVDLNAVLGYSYQNFAYSSKVIEMNHFRTTDLDLMINNIASANESANSVVVRNSSSTFDELQSYFGRVNLGFSDKYLFTATLRADGSTRFGGDNQYGYFPSAAFKWRLGAEGFMPEKLSDMSLRIGYGITGNQEIPHYLYASRQRYNDWDLDNNDGHPTGGGLDNVAFANPNLKWETTTQFNAGLDFAFGGGRLAGSLDVYSKHTKDLLFKVVSAQPAPQPFYWTNLDTDVANDGIELSLNFAALQRDNFRWNIALNGAYNRNEIKKLRGQYDTGAINGQGLSNAYAERLAEGQPLYAFFVRDFAGFDDNGIALYNGEGGGDYHTFVGKSPLPKLTVGLTNGFTFGPVDLSIFLNGQFGNYIYNNTANAYFTAGSLANGRNVTADVASSPESNLNAPDPSTRFLEDGSYLRVQDVTLGYRIKLNSRNISSLRIFVTGQNLAVFTNYSGQDPEVSIPKPLNDIPSFGIDYSAYPRARTIMIGGSVSF